MKRMGNCVFYVKNACNALRVDPDERTCVRCTFHKTEKQFAEGVENAEQLLIKKGLHREITANRKGRQIMSAVKDNFWEE